MYCLAFTTGHLQITNNIKGVCGWGGAIREEGGREGEGGGTHIDVDGEVLTEDLDLKLEVKLEVWFLVQLSQHVHDGHRPGTGRPEDLEHRGKGGK